MEYVFFWSVAFLLLDLLEFRKEKEVLPDGYQTRKEWFYLKLGLAHFFLMDWNVKYDTDVISKIKEIV